MKLVLIRHGQSTYNLEKKFTGWTDVPLSEKGIKEAKETGKILKEQGFNFDIAYTSVLTRAIDTLNYVLKEMNINPKIKYSYKLNERCYGALQGFTHEEMIKKYGEEKVHLFRRSADVRPPKLSTLDPRYPGNDKLYNDVPKQNLPLSENLLDTLNRVVSYYNSDIKKSLLNGQNVLVVAHGNSLRALIKYLEDINDEDIMSLEIATCVPYIYELDDSLNIINKYTLK